MVKLYSNPAAIYLLTALALWLVSARATAEVIHLKNGDVLHGSVVGANARRITLQTPYGRLVIPKKDIQRIDYEGEEEPSEEAPGKEEAKKAAPPKRKEKPDLPSPELARSVVSLEIRGRAFWYAFTSPPEEPADLRVRLRFFLSEVEAAMLMDSKPDTVDKNTFYNSFTFSPTDSQVVRTADGYSCRVQEAKDGRVVLRLDLPEEQREGQFLARMLYQVNEGSRQLPRWIDVVSRVFQVQVKAGKETYIILEQNASGLDYSGFFRKSMKNVESFQLSVLSAEHRELPGEPVR